MTDPLLVRAPGGADGAQYPGPEPPAALETAPRPGYANRPRGAAHVRRDPRRRDAPRRRRVREVVVADLRGRSALGPAADLRAEDVLRPEEEPVLPERRRPVLHGVPRRDVRGHDRGDGGSPAAEARSRHRARRVLRVPRRRDGRPPPTRRG